MQINKTKMSGFWSYGSRKWQSSALKAIEKTITSPRRFPSIKETI